MIEIQVPDVGIIRLEHVVSDYSGTLAIDGLLVNGVRERLTKLSEIINIHIVTADPYGKVDSELAGINCKVTMLSGGSQDTQKQEYVKNLGAENVVAIGNGNNDRKMLSVARIGIAICMTEGASVDAIKAATILVRSPLDALDMLLIPQRIRSTLRL